MVQYNKAARDLIPQIIERDGHHCECVQLDASSYLPVLEAKLREEVEEYLDNPPGEELVDLLEVIYAIGRLRGIQPDELNQIQEKKREDRGGFDQRLVLIKT